MPLLAILELHPGAVFGTLAAMVVLGVLTGLAVRALEKFANDPSRPTQESEPSWVPMVRSTLVVAAGAALVVILTVGATGGAYAIVLPVIVILLWAGRGIAADVLGGLQLAVTRPFGIGDWIDSQGHRGRVVAMGISHVVLRAEDETEIHLPNHRLATGELINVSRAMGDTPVEVELPLPDGVDPSRARARATICAATSPFASLHKRPETFLNVDAANANRVSVRVRGYVFDSDYAEVYESHIVEAWLEFDACFDAPAPAPRIVVDATAPPRSA